ncbi:MAG: hypothetical protein H6707_16025 [Deltaproteobacteria bacterium]|nr:hypothetical protein [Deltaproteobacteria bacterium]
MRVLSAAFLSVLTLTACASDDKPIQTDGGGADLKLSDASIVGDGATQTDGAAHDGLSGDGLTADAGTQPLQLPVAIGLVAINSDYQTSSLALIDAKTNAVTKDDCVNSGTTSPQLTAALSGDLALPSQPLPGNKLVIIDRKNATLTWVNPQSCAVDRQINVGTGFAANPQDLVVVNGKIYVARLEKNTKPTADPKDYDDGSDLLIVDDKTGSIDGRIDLSSYATTAAKPVWPRPSRLLVANGKIYVSLNNLGPNYAADEFGHGRVLEIDPGTNTVSKTFDLPSLSNCVGLSVSAQPGGLVLVCNGNFMAAKQLDDSGVAWIPLQAGAPPQKVVLAKAAGGPLGFSLISTLGPDKTVVSTAGDFSGTPPDRLFVVDFARDKATHFFDGTGGFVLQSAVVNPLTQQLYVAQADAKTPLVKVFDLSKAGQPVVGADIKASAKTGLPTQLIGWY